MKTQELQNQLAQTIYESLSQGKLPWTTPHFSTAILARNVVTGHVYKGTNTLSAWAYSMMYHEDEKPYFIGFQQLQNFHWKLKKGSKGLPLFVHHTSVKESTNSKGETEKEVIPFFKIVYVFHVADIDDSEGTVKVADVVAKWKAKQEERTDAQVIEEYEEMIRYHKPNISYGSQPCYVPLIDKIKMPKIGEFFSDLQYYEVLFHEMAHWTKHPQRVPRKEIFEDKGKKEAYAIEELIAELSAVFVMARTGRLIDSNLENHKAYIQSWASFVKDTPTLFFRCVGYANKIAEFLTTTESAKEQDVEVLEEIEA